MNKILKIGLMSDLHQDFPHNEFDHNKVADLCDVMVIAGDLEEGNHVNTLLPYVKAGKRVIYVPGNHEYYNNEINSLREDLILSGKNLGIDVLDRGTVYINGVRFLVCTLWTDFALYGDQDRLTNMTVIQYGLNDYHCIKFKTSSNDLRRLIPNDTLQEHIDSIVWLDNEFNNTWEGPTVVVTHHAPSIQSIASIFKADKAYNTGYASNLESHIKMWKPEFWLHGHMHLPFDYMVDNTRVICNPSGYTDQRSDNYGPKIIEI